MKVTLVTSLEAQKGGKVTALPISNLKVRWGVSGQSHITIENIMHPPMLEP
jgi:hypothetical protein